MPTFDHGPNHGPDYGPDYGPGPWQGRFFDGQTAQDHGVTIEITQQMPLALRLSGPSLDAPLLWPLEDLRALGDHATRDQIILTRHAASADESPRDPARLIINDVAAVGWLIRTRPNLYARDTPKGTGRRVLRNLGLAVGAVVLVLFVILPAMANTLARLIPLEREIAFGKSVVGQMEWALGGQDASLGCTNPDGLAALEAMLARLTAGAEYDYPLELQVFDHRMVNAFAAPGGQIVLVRGLLDKATGPDAVAGVLAHEIAHVVNRDAMRNALRAVGSAGIVSVLLGDVTGGALMVILAEQVINSSYSRDAERAADVFAHDMLSRAGISSDGLGDFFEQIAELQSVGRVPEYLSSHPRSQTRAAQTRAHAQAQGTTQPALDAAQWAALQAICE